MKIYQVHFGCQYEGGSTEKIYSTAGEARKYVLAKIKEDEERWTAYYNKQTKKDRKNYLGLGKWTETKPNCFESGSDIYLIIETEVKEIFEENDLKSKYQLEREAEEGKSE
jgi:hypothetical protein